MRHKHTLSHYKLLTGDMGRLYPIGLVEVLPKDTFQHSTSVFIRFSPMAAPVMHPVTVRVHHFFVPHRLTWPESEGGGFEQFITGGPTGADVQKVPVEVLTDTAGDLQDYFGLPRHVGRSVSALPTRAFNLIYNEYYRDEDLITARLATDVTVPLIAWEKDYLTMARPWPQKGPAVLLPLGTEAPVIPSIDGEGPTFITDGAGLLESNLATSATQDDVAHWNVGSSTGAANKIVWAEPGLVADLSMAQGVEINAFRKAFALQRYAEARARYGSRYVEYLRYLGVNPSDARLQRPEYLGGGKARVSMSEVLQTANVTAGEVERFGVGDLYGHGVASMRSNAYRRTFEEHGYCLTLLSVRPKVIWTDGVERHFLRRDREEFWQKELEQIGQQEIWNGEVYLDTETGDPYSTFGYQDRYREYRECQARISGEFRSTLDYWHLARDFAAAPVLNQSFVECLPSKRIFNVQNQHSLWIAAQHRLVARRLVGRSGRSRIM